MLLRTFVHAHILDKPQHFEVLIAMENTAELTSKYVDFAVPRDWIYCEALGWKTFSLLWIPK